MTTVRAPEDQSADRRDALRVGFFGGIALTVCVVVAVWIGLSGWRQSHDEQLRAEAMAAVEGELAECRDTVRDLADEEYGMVMQTRRAILAAQRGE